MADRERKDSTSPQPPDRYEETNRLAELMRQCAIEILALKLDLPADELEANIAHFRISDDAPQQQAGSATRESIILLETTPAVETPFGSFQGEVLIHPSEIMQEAVRMMGSPDGRHEVKTQRRQRKNEAQIFGFFSAWAAKKILAILIAGPYVRDLDNTTKFSLLQKIADTAESRFEKGQQTDLG